MFDSPMVPNRSNRAKQRTYDRQSTPSPTGHKKIRWCALVHVWCKLVIVWCTFVFFGTAFVRFGAVLYDLMCIRHGSHAEYPPIPSSSVPDAAVC